MLSLVRHAYSGLASVEDDVVPNRPEIDAADDELHARILALSSEVGNYLVNTSSDSAQQAFLVAWNAFVADFNDWHDDWYTPVGLWARRAKLLAYRKRFADLQDWFKGLGNPSSTPAYKPSELPSPSPWPVIATYAVYALMAGVAIYGVAQVFPAVKALGTGLRLLKNPRRRRRVIRRRRRRS
jgi:hypothetical protein